VNLDVWRALLLPVRNQQRWIAVFLLLAKKKFSEKKRSAKRKEARWALNWLTIVALLFCVFNLDCFNFLERGPAATMQKFK